MRIRLAAFLLRFFLTPFSDLGDPGGGGGAPPDLAPPAGAPPAPTPEPGAPAPGGDEPPAPDGGDGDGFEKYGPTYEQLLAQEGDTINGVPRSVLERHAREHRSYRERWQPIERAFNALHPDDTQGFVSFLEAMTSNDQELRSTAAQWMREVLDSVSPAQAAAIAQAVDAAPGTAPATPGTPAAADDFDPFDPDAINKLVEQRLEAVLAERDSKAQQDQLVAQAEREMTEHASKLAKDFGIEGFADPTSVEFGLLLLEANKLSSTIPDPMVRLDKAAESIRDRLDSAGQKLLKSKGADATPSPAAPDGGTPGGTKKPSSMDEAAEAASRRLDSILRGDVGN